MHDGWNENLNLKIEHMVLCHRLADFKKVLLAPSVVIVDQEAARIPVVFCVIEDFELNEGSLAGLNCCVILILWDSILLWYMFHMR